MNGSPSEVVRLPSNHFLMVLTFDGVILPTDRSNISAFRSLYTSGCAVSGGQKYITSNLRLLTKSSSGVASVITWISYPQMTDCRLLS